MLGVKSNRGVVKGAFADKLREEIAIAEKNSQQRKARVQTKSIETAKK